MGPPTPVEISSPCLTLPHSFRSLELWLEAPALRWWGWSGGPGAGGGRPQLAELLAYITACSPFPRVQTSQLASCHVYLPTIHARTLTSPPRPNLAVS